MLYRVTVEGTSREVYLVDAPSAAEARKLWQDERPIVTEIGNAEVVDVAAED